MKTLSSLHFKKVPAGMNSVQTFGTITVSVGYTPQDSWNAAGPKYSGNGSTSWEVAVWRKGQDMKVLHYCTRRQVNAILKNTSALGRMNALGGTAA